MNADFYKIDLAKRVICALIDGKQIIHEPSGCLVRLPTEGSALAVMESHEYRRELSIINVLIMANQFVIKDEKY